MASHLIISERFVIQSCSKIHALLEKFLQEGGRVTIYAESDNPTQDVLYSQGLAIYIILAHNYSDRLHFVNVPTIPNNEHFDIRPFIKHSKSEDSDYFLSERFVETKPGTIKQYFYTDVTNLDFVTKVITYLIYKHLPPIFPQQATEEKNNFNLKTLHETSNEKQKLLNLDLNRALQRKKLNDFSFFSSSLAARYHALPIEELEEKNENGLAFENSILAGLKPSIEFFIKEYCGSVGTDQIYERSLIPILSNLISSLATNDKHLLLSILLKTEISAEKWLDDREQYAEVIGNLLGSLPLENSLDIALTYYTWNKAQLSLKEILFKFYENNKDILEKNASISDRDKQKYHQAFINPTMESKQDEIIHEAGINYINIDYNAIINDYISGHPYQNLKSVLPHLPIERTANITLELIKYAEAFHYKTKRIEWQNLEITFNALSIIINQLPEEDIGLVLRALPLLLALLNRDTYNSRVEEASLRILSALQKHFNLLADEDRKYLVEYILKAEKYTMVHVYSDYIHIFLTTTLQIKDIAYRENLVGSLEKLCCTKYDSNKIAPYYINQAKNILTSCSLILAYHNEVDKNIQHTGLPEDINNIVRSYLRPN